MDRILTIASFNTQNPYMKEKKKEEENIEELIKIIREEKIDILCCQEMLENSINLLKKKLPTYIVKGNYRYGKNIFTRNIQILKKYNEATPIITNQPVIITKNYALPWFSNHIKELQQALFKYRSITPRILTEVLLEEKEYPIKVLSTHLEKRVQSIKSKQLKKIEKVISKTTYPTILAGDFNLKTDQPIFEKFIQKMNEYHLKRVEINQKIWKHEKKNQAVDHIFIPANWCVLEQKIIDNTISDHYMILVKVKI